MSALQQLAAEVEDLFHVSCRFECAEPVLIADVGVATHLYHIAQEAVNNAIKHGDAARTSRSRWSVTDDTGTLADRGRRRRHSRGADEPPGHGPAHHELPRQHDRRLTGQFAPASHGGTVVCCRFPLER